MTTEFLSQVTEQTGICIHWLEWGTWSTFKRIDNIDEETICFKGKRWRSRRCTRPTDKDYENQFGESCDAENVKDHISYDINRYIAIETGEETQEDEQNELTNENIPQCVWEDYNLIHPVKGLIFFLL